MKQKWWGWGDPNIRFQLSEYPKFIDFLKSKFDLGELVQPYSLDLAGMALPDTRLTEAMVSEFERALPGGRFKIGLADRVAHSLGKSYTDLVRVRTKKLSKACDGVAYPNDVSDVIAIVALCIKHDLALVPFGGGTSVVGGVEPEAGGKRAVVVLDTTNMKKVINIDSLSMTAEVEAGIYGPELESELQKAGFTLGHYPQSFEFSTLGGWIAAKSSGQNSVMYGGIEKNVISLTAVTAKGELTSLSSPRMACGPELKEVLTGSEGIFGVITKARIRIHKKPANQRYFMMAFRSFSDSAAVAREIIQQKIPVAMIRVSDESESDMLFRLSKGYHSLLESLGSGLVKKYLKFRGIYPPKMSVMLVGLEGDERMTGHEIYWAVKEICAKYACVSLGDGPGRKWLKDRFFLPYLRDDLMDQGLLVETFETSTTWDSLPRLYSEVRSALSDVFLLCHISHVYDTGASLYFTFITKTQSGRELEDWRKYKDLANSAILRAGGAISHHHGIGVDHRIGAVTSELHREVLRGIKRAVDPTEIFNPGKLI